MALDVLQRDPEEVAFIDDRQGNCEAAEALGILAIHYLDEAQCVQALERLGLHAGVRT
jgi:FMN phosphatase YigB (HAD superfamily)